MATKFCPDCGGPHDCTGAPLGELEARVRVAEIEANRDITIAKYGARTDVALAETYAEAEADRAEGVIEGMETVLELAGGQAEPAAGEPIVIESEDLGEAEAAEDLGEAELGEPDSAPPVVVDVPAASASKSGYWSMYR